ncbi:cbb3-type cytochrome oxidase subunit 3 [Candidatus Bandiella euplotis]|uniref:Cbb3-type cytochrome c oxidase subunit IV n=1 Tax=Candidatus Bandiella euplotis TaxID=1664265 RepID=A0ABZ0UM89_9RICK|nr:Cbb3-type cytochrome c oxidase subunit IV [Candidatus Bandiella woodruffii]
MREILYIKIGTLIFLSFSIVVLLGWLYRPKSKKLYEKLSRIPINKDEAKK